MIRRGILFLSLLAAFGLRAWDLGTQSIWIDEGLSIWDAQKSTIELLATHAQWDIHPPLYYLVLHFWVNVAGSSEFAVRFFSVASGVLTVPLVYWLVRLLQRRAAVEAHAVSRLLATLPPLLVAVSPFLVFTSQDARMYGLLTMLGVLATGALWKAIEATPSFTAHHAARWSLYAVAVAAMAYTHYFTAFILAFHGIFLLLTTRHYRSRIYPWMLSLGGAAVLYIPWWQSAWTQATRLIEIPDVWPGVLSARDVLARIVVSLVSGSGADGAQAVPMLAAAAFVVVGMVLAARGAGGVLPSRAALLVILYVVVPEAMFFAALYIIPKFVERYAVIAVPGLMLMLGFGAQGWGWLAARRRLAAGYVLIGLVALLMVGISVDETLQVYSAPGYAKDDTRGVAEYISSRAEAGDVIVLMMDTSVSFRYYYKKDTPISGIDPVRNVDYLADRLEAALEGKQRLWLVLYKADWADPSRFVRDYLEDTFDSVPIEHKFHGFELKLYRLDPSEHYDVSTSPEIRRRADFGDQIEILGNSHIPASATAGDSIPLLFYWRLPRLTDDDLLVSLRLRRGSMTYWAKDRRPTAYGYPTFYWPAKEMVVGRLPLEIPPGTPPGQYAVELALYSVEDKRNLDLLGLDRAPSGTWIDLGTVEVARPSKPADLHALGLDRSTGRQLTSALALLGSEIGGSSVQPGQTLPLTLRWLATATPADDYRVLLSMTDGNGQVHRLYEGAPVQGEYPMQAWRAGELVNDRYNLVVPAGVAPGEASLYLSLVPPSIPAGAPLDSAPSTILLGKLQVTSRTHITEPASPPQYPVGARVGEFARLVGYDLSGDTAVAGGSLKITLQWQSAGPADANYKVFVHLLDGQEHVRSQQDNQPDRDRAPTSGWVAGEYISDVYQLDLPAGLPAGRYQLEVGMYDPQTGARQSIATASGEPIGDRLLLRPVTVTAR